MLVPSCSCDACLSLCTWLKWAQGCFVSTMICVSLCLCLCRCAPTCLQRIVDFFGRRVHREEGDDDNHFERQKHFVVKVFCMFSSQDPSNPWTNKQQEDRSGSGCVMMVEGQRCILTNAHVVADASYVEVRKAGNAKKFCCKDSYGAADAFHSVTFKSIAGKHVLITGGSQGLGLALAKLCYLRGAKVTIASRTKAKLEQACSEIRQLAGVHGAKIQFVILDVSSMRSAQFAEVMSDAAKDFGRVDVVVANAGTGIAKLLVGTPLEQLDELMEAQISTNLMGSLRCAMAAAQVMASDGQGGAVAIVSSAAGLISLPGVCLLTTGSAHSLTWEELEAASIAL
ncbi:unnamed protein product [Effrenium voratum]|nr:unnamed protein product [Effrenium voratum]